MAQKYEHARRRFDSSFSFAMTSERVSVSAEASSSSEEDEDIDFALKGSFEVPKGFTDSIITLDATIRHDVDKTYPQLTFRVKKIKPNMKYARKSEPCNNQYSKARNKRFTDGFRKIEGVFYLKDANGLFFSETRILILDLDGCNVFECSCLDSSTDLCYGTELKCTAEELKSALVKCNDGHSSLNARIAGFLISYDEPITKSSASTLAKVRKLSHSSIIQKPCDLIITVDDQKFQAQKGILAEQSDVFNTMFSIEMKESVTSKLEITDMSAEGVEALFNYLQEDKLDIFCETQILLDLFHAANKYNIVSLKEALIELSILMEIEECTLDHAVGFFCFAQHFKSRVLETRALEIFKRLRSGFNESKAIDKFIKTHPVEVKKLLILYSNGRGVK